MAVKCQGPAPLKRPFTCSRADSINVLEKQLWTHHEVNVAFIIDEVLHQLLKAVFFSAHLRGDKAHRVCSTRRHKCKTIVKCYA